MSNHINFYPGADHGLDPSYGATEYESTGGYRIPIGDFSLTTRPDTANQLKEVTDKINTGAKSIEITGISPGVFESVPEQHLEEINRLKKLTGMSLTFHGPIIEPTGFSQQGWSESQREQNEEQMWSALNRSRKLDPDGNIIVTFHSAASLPEMNMKVKQGKDGEKSVEMMVFDERAGKVTTVSPRKEYLLKEGESLSTEEGLKEINKESWKNSISNIGLSTGKAQDSVELALRQKFGIEHTEKDLKSLKESYKSFREGKGKEHDKLNRIAMDNLTYADAHIRGSYLQLQEMFNLAYENAEKDNTKDSKETISKLKKFKKDYVPIIAEYRKDPSNVLSLIKAMDKGQKVLGSIKSPQMYRPLNDFAIDKAADTFSNLALRSYKAHKENAPIISIENPPANQGLSRAEDLRELVKVSRKKFVKNAIDKFGMSEDTAKKQAEKLIGVTWDVGHINMIKKFGYDDKDIVKETKKIAPYVKHVHLSDNFGMDHTELPMGMGNVPTDKMLKEVSKFNKNTRKVIEAGNWYQHFQTSPLTETMQSFDSPIYSMKMAPSWGQIQASGEQASYFSGYGNMLPENHFSTYGAGFSNLPAELGGQMGGQSRMSGTPIE